MALPSEGKSKRGRAEIAEPVSMSAADTEAAACLADMFFAAPEADKANDHRKHHREWRSPTGGPATADVVDLDHHALAQGTRHAAGGGYAVPDPTDGPAERENVARSGGGDGAEDGEAGEAAARMTDMANSGKSRGKSRGKLPTQAAVPIQTALCIRHVTFDELRFHRMVSNLGPRPRSAVMAMANTLAHNRLCRIKRSARDVAREFDTHSGADRARAATYSQAIEKILLLPPCASTAASPIPAAPVPAVPVSPGTLGLADPEKEEKLARERWLKFRNCPQLPDASSSMPASSSAESSSHRPAPPTPFLQHIPNHSKATLAATSPAQRSTARQDSERSSSSGPGAGGSPSDADSDGDSGVPGSKIVSHPNPNRNP